MSVQKHQFSQRLLAVLLVLTFGLVAVNPAQAANASLPVYSFGTPIFGLSASPDGSLLVADAGAGIVELRKGEGSLVASLPGVTDVAPIGRGVMFAVTGGGDAKLYKVSQGKTKVVADLGAFEAAVNPHPAAVDSNPFDVAALADGSALVADAGGNDLLVVNAKGQVDWVAVLPDQLVPTANAKSLVGCPTDNPELGFVCNLPEMMPAEPVASSVAVGPDGAYYMGELKGFPGPTGYSRIWRIEPGARHVRCGVDAGCTQVANGFTSIVDLAFGPDGRLYVTEIDEGSFLTVELLGMGINKLQGGTVNACNISTWTCAQVATGLILPIATTVDKKGQAYVAVHALMPDAQVIALP